MQGEAKEHWRILCEQVAEERNPQRFSELMAELLDALKKKDERLKHPPQGTAAGAGSSSIETRQRKG